MRINSSEKMVTKTDSLRPNQKQRIQLLTEAAVERHQNGQLEAANLIYETILEIDPVNVFVLQLLGVLASQLGQHDVSLNLLNKAISLKPDYADALNNRGIVLKEIGSFNKALEDFNKAIKLKPDDFEILNNRGIVLTKLNYAKKALADFDKAISLNPDNTYAYNNRGNALKSLHRFDEALDDYSKALSLKPDNHEAQQGIIQLLAEHEPKRFENSPFVKANKAIKEIFHKSHVSTSFSDEDVLTLLSNALNILKKLDLRVKTTQSQIFRQNSVDLNCKRHFSVFERYNIIPAFCFGCFKVEIKPRSVIELIKLFIIFDQLKLDENNTRKCMVELREKISGFYKGLIYCSSPEQAFDIADRLQPIIEKTIGSKLPVTVKRGCSEYSIAFPDYGTIDQNSEKLMVYKDSWRLTEKIHDREYPNIDSGGRRLNLNGLTLNDILIIQNWVSYARGIGDFSCEGVNGELANNKNFYDPAVQRLKHYTYSV